MEPLFLSYNQYLHKLFHCKVYKISLDGGFTCPNRDGTKGTNGCIFCYAGSSSLTQRTKTIKEQLEENSKVRRTRYGAEKFIAYFQAFSNTYAPTKKLKSIYDQVLGFEDIVGLSIGTRADCIDEEKLSLIASYKKYFPYINLEYGLQSIHNKTLKFINQGSTYEDFLQAVQLTQRYDLTYTVHVILNLPNETKEEQLQTAEYLAKLNIPQIKIHLLCAMKNTYLEQLYNKGLWQSYTFDKYIPHLCDFLERLPPACVIHRLGGGGHPKEVLSPLWLYEKRDSITTAVNEEFKRRNTYQGFLFNKSF